jgi:hypothetical protein
MRGGVVPVVPKLAPIVPSIYYIIYNNISYLYILGTMGTVGTGCYVYIGVSKIIYFVLYMYINDTRRWFPLFPLFYTE